MDEEGVSAVISFIPTIIMTAIVMTAVVQTLFGLMHHQGRYSGTWTELEGMKAASGFKVLNYNGEFGRMEKSEITQNLERQSSGYCKIDLIKTGSNEDSFIRFNTEGVSCREVERPVELSIYGPDEGFHSLKVGSKDRSVKE